MPRSVSSRIRFIALVAAGIAVATSFGSAHAKTFVIPHILERSGNITNTQYSFDTDLYITYTGGLAGDPGSGGATVDLYLYNQTTGQPMQSLTNQDVCNPCSFPMGPNGGSNVRKRSIRIDDLIVNAGGFPANVVLGFGIVVVGGMDPNRVALQGFVTNSHTSAFDLSVFGFEPQEIAAAAVPALSAAGATQRTFVMPHVFEKSGKSIDTQYTFDTSIYAVYSAGLAGVPAGAGATVDLYLFDSNGVPWSGPLGDVCNPCQFNVSDAHRKQSISLEDLITINGGGFSTPVLTGFAVAVVQGDAASVNLQGFVVNAHTSPFDLSVFGFTPEEIQAGGAVAVPGPDQVGAALELRGSPNPSRGDLVFSYALARAADVTLDVFDAAGRRVATVFSGRRDAGAGTLRWDRRDEAGNRLPSGVYYGRLRADDGSRVSKLVFLPE